MQGYVGTIAQAVANSGDFSGALYMSTGGGGAASGGGQVYAPRSLYFDNARVAPVANKLQPRAWGALACVYLGQPAS